MGAANSFIPGPSGRRSKRGPRIRSAVLVRLATVSYAGATSAARVEGDKVVLLPEPDLGALLARTDWREHAATAGRMTTTREDVRFAATVPGPHKILCAG